MHDTTALDIQVLDVLRRELRRLATREDELASSEAAQVPYWAPTPTSVLGHRAAATALREDADKLDSAASRREVAA